MPRPLCRADSASRYRAQRQAGFGLLDGLLFLALTAVVAVIGFALWNNSSQASKATATAAQLSAVRAAVKSLWGDSATAAASVTTVAVAHSDLVPGTFSSTEIRNPFGNLVMVTGTSGGGYSVAMGTMSAKACIQVLNTLDNDPDVTSLSLVSNDEALTFTGATPLSADEANELCTTPGGTAIYVGLLNPSGAAAFQFGSDSFQNIQPGVVTINGAPTGATPTIVTYTDPSAPNTVDVAYDGLGPALTVTAPASGMTQSQYLAQFDVSADAGQSITGVNVDIPTSMAQDCDCTQELLVNGVDPSTGQLVYAAQYTVWPPDHVHPDEVRIVLDTPPATIPAGTTSLNVSVQITNNAGNGGSVAVTGTPTVSVTTN